MIPFIPINRGHRPQSYKADLSAPTPSPDSATGSMASSFSFGYSDISSPASLPPPPPPSPNDMLDITPQKCSFSNTLRMNSTCAFPSWPNRPSLLNGGESSASSYLSDEDLNIPESPGVDEESAAHNPLEAGGPLTTEQQIQLIRAAAEEEQCRARFMAQVQAHARAQQALKMNQQAVMERETTKRKPRRVRPDRKRRITFTSATSSNRGSTGLTRA
ncbi:hypothetical protein PHISCL_01493 [Aspergillus sclerotialis]|uniref:Uncharacterized protein n=1 Tax=Aspergillus sclerotialis TaxID=2070753 RepID=A0A3A2ZUY3_9EURO|nr:hypothetical protein PHISCL_01493 [Aspergillus sclerotialis]